MNKNALAIFAHPDDAEFLASGSMAKWADEGHQVHAISASGSHKLIDARAADRFSGEAPEPREGLSSGHTTDYTGKLFLSTGDVLYSDRSRPMLTITADRVGRHIMLYVPCSQAMFEKSYHLEEPHPNCLDNLAGSLAQFGIRRDQIGIPLNLFMNVAISTEGEITIKPPVSKAGDYVELRAEMDLVAAVSACPAGLCNDFTWSPIDIAINSGVNPE